jgi:hypothetical protein
MNQENGNLKEIAGRENHIAPFIKGEQEVLSSYPSKKRWTSPENSILLLA